jgi:hypothetical protein
VIDLSGLEADLASLRGIPLPDGPSDLLPYLVLGSIDTNRLRLPADLLGNDGTSFAAGVDFSSPTLHARAAQLLDRLLPLLRDNGGFFISVGNEVDIWLRSRPDQIAAFAGFTEHCRNHARSAGITDLAIGVTLTSASTVDADLWTPVIAACDALAFIHYHTGDPDFRVENPATISDHLDAMAALAGGRQILLQELDCPSGAINPGNGGSESLQAEFFSRAFTAIAERPWIRFVNVLHLNDYTQADVDTFTSYYLDQPLAPFAEFLGTLGLFRNDRTEKAAWPVVLEGLRFLAKRRQGSGRRIAIDVIGETTWDSAPGTLLSHQEGSRQFFSNLERNGDLSLIPIPAGSQ